MKIAFITTNLRGGGAEKAVVKLASLLAQRSHEVHVILLENIVEHELDPAFALHALSPPGRARSKGILGKYLAALKLRRLFGRLQKSAPFDLVVSTLPYADEVVSLARLPRVWYRIANTLSAEIEALRKSSPAKAERRLRRYRSLYSGQNLIAVSEGVADDLRSNLGLKANIVQIYNPFEIENIRRLADEAEPDLPAVPYIVHVGRFVPQKRHDLLFEAFKPFAATHKLVLLVNPDARLEEMLRRYGIRDNTILAGFRKNPYPWLKHADLLVLCSDREGMPNVLIEAIICGTQVVSTDCPSGPREVMTGELIRHLVPVNDIHALVGTMGDALAHPLQLARMEYEKFTAAHVAEKYENLGLLWKKVL